MKENTTDAVINAPEATFGIPTVRDNEDKLWLAEQIPTREEIERIGAAAALDDDLDEDTRTTGVEHMTPDNDPYGWIAGVEAAHPDFEPDPPKADVEHVLVWQHGMIEPQRFDRAVGKVLPNGTLLITRPGSEVPLKGYAPNVWVTFEHIGERYHALPQRLPHAGRVQTTRYAEQERAAVSMARSNAMLAEHADEAVQVFTDPIRRTPPTFETDADDTLSIPAVRTDEEGGGVDRPKARGAREDAEPTGPTPRPGTGVPATPDDEKTPGRLRSLWHALRNPDWDED